MILKIYTCQNGVLDGQGLLFQSSIEVTNEAEKSKVVEFVRKNFPQPWCWAVEEEIAPSTKTIEVSGVHPKG